MAQNIPLVSVMILTYNHEKYIRQSVESALNQQCSYHYEIVISDDYSTDNTRAICSELQKKYPDKIQLYLNGYNKGVIQNYFDTIRLCRGKYIADCSGDDYWLDPLKLQKQVDILEAREDIVLVHTNWKDLINETGELLNDMKSKKKNWKPSMLGEKDLSLYLNQKNMSLVNINTTCFRKKVALDIYSEYNRFFDKSLYACEDFQLLFLMLTKGYLYYIDEDTTVYRIVNESVSRTNNFNKYFNHQYKKTILRFNLAKEFNVDLTEYVHIQSYLLMSLAFKAKKSNYAKDAKKAFLSNGYLMSKKANILYPIASNKFLLYIFHPVFLIIRKIKYSLK